MVQSIRVGGLTAAQKDVLAGAEQTENKDQPNGYPGLDGDGKFSASMIQIRTGLAATIDSLLLGNGELAYQTDKNKLVIGDGETEGGLVVQSIENVSMIHVRAQGTPSENFAEFMAAYALAGTLLEEEETSAVTVVLWPGVYDAQGNVGFSLNLSGVNLSALVPGSAAILCEDVTSTPVFVFGGEAAGSISGLQILSAGPAIAIAPSTVTKQFSQLTILSFGGLGIYPASGGNYDYMTFSDVVCNAGTLMGGVDGANAGTSVQFERCKSNGTGSYFGGATAAGAGTFSGTIVDCQLSATEWNLNLAGVLNRVQSNAPVTRLTSTARVWNSTFSTTSDALQNNSSSVAIKAAGNIAGGSLLGTNVTNALTTTNTESAGTGLW